MSSWRAFCETAHLTCLGIWVGASSIAVATAAVAFPTLKDMHPHLPGLARGFDDDSFRFAAGEVAQRVFLIGDIVAFACATIAAVTLLVLIAIFRIPARRPATIIRALALGVALASLASIMMIIAPKINAASRLHYEAAKSGDAVAAALHKQAVDDLHPIATNLFAAEIAGAFIALIAGAWSLAQPWRAEPEPQRLAVAYPEPELLKRQRP